MRVELHGWDGIGIVIGIGSCAKLDSMGGRRRRFDFFSLDQPVPSIVSVANCSFCICV